MSTNQNNISEKKLKYFLFAKYLKEELNSLEAQQMLPARQGVLRGAIKKILAIVKNIKTDNYKSSINSNQNIISLTLPLKNKTGKNILITNKLEQDLIKGQLKVDFNKFSESPFFQQKMKEIKNKKAAENAQKILNAQKLINAQKLLNAQKAVNEATRLAKEAENTRILALETSKQVQQNNQTKTNLNKALKNVEKELTNVTASFEKLKELVAKNETPTTVVGTGGTKKRKSKSKKTTKSKSKSKSRK